MTKLAIMKLIWITSLQYGIDPQLAIAVAQKESNLNPNIIGITQDIGLFQLNPKSFPTYTKQQLLNPEINTKLGVQYLIQMKKECKYQKDLQWLTCWNLGKTYVARKIHHPDKWPYVKSIEDTYARL